MLNDPIFAYTYAYPAPRPRFGPLQASHRQWPICANPYATRVTAYVGSNSETDRRVEMPLFRYFRESAAFGREEIWMAVIAGKWIDANVRLRLTANRTYGLLPFICIDIIMPLT